jgi:hypothetical protein
MTPRGWCFTSFGRLATGDAASTLHVVALAVVAFALSAGVTP